jgi:Amt family ammonium transporter
MKRLLAVLALVGAVGITSPGWAEEPAAPAAVTEAVATEAAAPAEAAPAAAEAEAPAAEAPKPTYSKADNAWMIVATALVIMMSIPGLALFYGGMVRAKNMLSVLMQVLTVFSMITVLWVVYGYSVAFTEGGPFFGGFDKLFLTGVTPDSLGATFTKGVFISEMIFVVFQGAFAAITCCLIVGAFAERIKFGAVLVFCLLWFTFAYLPAAHMVWYFAGPDAYTDAAAGAAATATAGYLWQMGALDFAGGTVVHINAGVAGLVGAFMVGKRLGYGKEAMAPHSLTMTMIGTSLLWVGWFGFNAGSALEINGLAGLAFLNTWAATAMAAFTWTLLEWVIRGKPSMLGAASGAVAGLVAITPACGWVGVGGALAIGLISSAICMVAVHNLKRLLNVDDSLDVFGVHGIGGIVGALLTGVFCAPSLGGTGLWDFVTETAVADYSIATQVLIQAKAVGLTVVWSAVVAFIAFKLVDITIGLRPSADEEREGLDVNSHGEKAYS